MRSAKLLILDEPTAAIDGRAEYEVFVRFNQLMAGRMAVVISHRFSTVRMADRIVVLSQGRVLEEGTHESLATAGGLYAELFEMQAAGYRLTGSRVPALTSGSGGAIGMRRGPTGGVAKRVWGGGKT